MAIPTIWSDLWLLYLIVGLAAAGFIFCQFIKFIVTTWPIEDWLVKYVPDPPCSATVVIEFPLLSALADDNDGSVSFTVIHSKAGEAEKLAEKIRTNWVADYGDLTPLPDFLNSGKNNSAYEEALVELRLA